jgi:hypothetical protein
MNWLTSQEIGEFLAVIPVTVSAEEISLVVASRESFEMWKAQSEIDVWLAVYKGRMGTEALTRGNA